MRHCTSFGKTGSKRRQRGRNNHPTNNVTPMASTKKLTVFYDGACPLCEREIGFYRKQRGADEVCWIDVSRSSNDRVTPGLSRDQALARFHVMRNDGTVVSGGQAFAELWVALPGFRIWGRFFRTPPLTWLMNRSYNLFLKIRPLLQTIIARRQGRKL